MRTNPKSSHGRGAFRNDVQRIAEISNVAKIMNGIAGTQRHWFFALYHVADDDTIQEGLFVIHTGSKEIRTAHHTQRTRRLFHTFFQLLSNQCSNRWFGLDSRFQCFRIGSNVRCRTVCIKVITKDERSLITGNLQQIFHHNGPMLGPMSPFVFGQTYTGIHHVGTFGYLLSRLQIFHVALYHFDIGKIGDGCVLRTRWFRTRYGRNLPRRFLFGQDLNQTCPNRTCGTKHYHLLDVN
mmetsp:Transcript_32350/g.74312  ORF Transcript_32350/g.74312 Transcript_32350/m.74312 type:complete len:238 (-) Transcript_32350:41-754(-)